MTTTTDHSRRRTLPDDPAAARAVKLERFGPGPWIDEPDRLEWRSEVGGLPCLITRQPELGNLCGYVAVPPGHPWHGGSYDDIEASTHGGLTYSDRCQGDVCHVPQPGEPDDVWWLGFDCAHGFDLMPQVAKLAPDFYDDRGHGTFREVYRDLAYVRACCEELAAQAAEAAAR